MLKKDLLIETFSKEVVKIIEDYNYDNTFDKNNLLDFISDLEHYDKFYGLNDNEKNFLLKLKEQCTEIFLRNIKQNYSDSDDSIKKFEIKYNGDPFTYYGYEFIEDNKRL